MYPECRRRAFILPDMSSKETFPLFHGMVKGKSSSFDTTTREIKTARNVPRSCQLIIYNCLSLDQIGFLPDSSSFPRAKRRLSSSFTRLLILHSYINTIFQAKGMKQFFYPIYTKHSIFKEALKDTWTPYPTITLLLQRL